MTITYDEAGVTYDSVSYKYDGDQIITVIPGYRVITTTILGPVRTWEALGPDRTASLINDPTRSATLLITAE